MAYQGQLPGYSFENPKLPDAQAGTQRILVESEHAFAFVRALESVVVKQVHNATRMVEVKLRTKVIPFDASKYLQCI